jgi:outer membrane protein insertion porin family
LPRRRPSRAGGRRRAAGLRRPAALVLATLLAVLPGSARGRSDLESQLRTVTDVRFVGRHGVPARELRAVLKTRPPSSWPWAERRPLRADFLASDCRAIELVCQQHGFLDASVRDSLVPLRNRAKVRVLFLVREGPRSRIGRVDFPGLAAVPAGTARHALYARVGRPFNPAFLVADRTLLARLEGERGHLPRITGSARRERPDSLRVLVSYAVDEGPRYLVGQTRVLRPEQAGVRTRMITRELLLAPGSVYRASRVEESQERLSQTGLFSEVQITPVPDSTRAVVDFTVLAHGRKPRWIDAGVGSGTQERLRFTGDWGTRVLAGRALQGAIGGSVALDQNADMKRPLLLRAEASGLEPWLFGTRNRGQVTIYAEQRRDFRSDTLEVAKRDHGVTFQVQHDFARLSYVRLTQDNTWIVRQEVEFLKLPDPLPQAMRDSIVASFLRHYSTHRLELAGVRDLRDNPLQTSRGHLLVASAEVAGGPFKGSTSFTKFQLSSSWFTPLPRPGWILATRVRGGVVKPFGQRKDFVPLAGVDPEVARVPTEDAFRLGGVNSVRGYAENEIAPAGGLALLGGNVELRVPVVGLFGLELYVDGGNVWARPEFIRARDFTPRLGHAVLDAGQVRYTWGVGGRFSLAFAPVRFDVTWGAEPGHRAGRMQFAVGPTF